MKVTFHASISNQFLSHDLYFIQYNFLSAIISAFEELTNIDFQESYVPFSLQHYQKT